MQNISRRASLKLSSAALVTAPFVRVGWQVLAPIVVDNPLAGYPDRDWEKVYRDPYRVDKRLPGPGDHQLHINPQAAKDLGIEDGDYVYVDENPADRPYIGWKPDDPFYKVSRLMLRAKYNPAYPYHIVMMKHAPFMATETSVAAHETRPMVWRNRKARAIKRTCVTAHSNPSRAIGQCRYTKRIRCSTNKRRACDLSLTAQQTITRSTPCQKKRS